MNLSRGQTGKFTEEVERRFADAIKHLEAGSCDGSTNDFIKAIDSKPYFLARVPNTLLAPLNI